jgi:single-strand DNA-binding protein
MIKLQAIGYLGKDATINHVNGKHVINFSVAHSNSYTNQQGQKVENTIWVNCAYWLERTLVADYLKKGTHVYVEGTPSLTSYRNEQGVTIPQLQLRIENLQLLSNKPAGQQSQANADAPPLDDLPF